MMYMIHMINMIYKINMIGVITYCLIAVGSAY